MKQRLLTLLTFCLLSGESLAAESGAQKALTQLVKAVNTGDTELCGRLLTKTSQGYCDRFIGYGLLPCVPKQVSRESEKTQGQHTVLRVRVDGIGGTPRYARLAFIKESGKWKLDVPQSLRIGLGADWQKRMNLMEQVYLIARAQWGDEISCDKLNTMVDETL